MSAVGGEGPGAGGIDGESTNGTDDGIGGEGIVGVIDVGAGERELLFAGFSDVLGERDSNLLLSLRRARSVYEAVTQIAGDAPVNYSIDAFGAAMPMACDEVPWGRRANRRVEVWVRTDRGDNAAQR